MDVIASARQTLRRARKILAEGELPNDAVPDYLKGPPPQQLGFPGQQLGFPGQPAPLGTPKLEPTPEQVQFHSFGDPEAPLGSYGGGPLSGGPKPSEESRPSGGSAGGGSGGSSSRGNPGAGSAGSAY